MVVEKKGENISYLIPRDPSIKCWDDRVKLPVPCTKNLIQLGVDDFEETMGDKIKVYLRLKPPLVENTGNLNTYTVLNSTTLQTEAPKDSVSYKNVANGVGKLIHKFTFSLVLDQDTDQAALFKKCAVKSLKKFIKGENFLLMAYGTTSAGKTYTMQGNVDQPGVIPRALDFVFSSLKDNIITLCRYLPHQYNDFLLLTEDQLLKDLAHKNYILSTDLSKNQRYPDASHVTLQTTTSSGYSDVYENMTFKEMQSHLVDTEIFDFNSNMYKYGVWISMIEIYNEQVYDLLEIPNKNEPRQKLMFKDDELGNTFVKNLHYVNVCSGHEAFQILQFGRNNLHLAPTALNLSSSRSHCIFIITLAKFLDYDSSSHAIISRYSFCDLAGMERAKKTLNVKDRLVESKAINTSLSILVKCLTTIKENQNNKEKKMIPYRESKLTKLFRDAVTGKEQFSLIVNITKEPNLFDETLNVLKFSAIAQKIVPQNIFIKPKVKKLITKSRFSQIVANYSYNSKTIDWDASTMVDSISNKEVFENNNTSEIDELRDLVQRLKQELEKERKRGEQIEADIREELTSEFSEILKKQNECSRQRLESEVGRLEEMYERKQKRIVKYYEFLSKIKRRKHEEEDEISDMEKCEEKLKEVQNELQSLMSANENFKEQIQQLTEEHNRTLSECSELRFIIAEKDRLLEDLKKTNEAKNVGEYALEIELKNQLEEAKKKITHFKNLLDDAAADHKEFEENIKYLTKENEVLEQYLAEDREKVEDLQNENSKLQKMLSHKNLMIEKLEETNDKLTEELTFNAADKNVEEELQEKINELEQIQNEMEKTVKKLEEVQSELEAVKSENTFLESDLESYKNKVACLENKILNMEQNMDNKKEIELELKISELNNEIEKLQNNQKITEELTEEKKTLEKKCNELTSEIQVLQSEIKNILPRFQKAEEVDNLKKANEILVNESSEIKERNKELENKILELTDDMKSKSVLLNELTEIKERNKELENNVMELTTDIKNKNILINELGEIKERNKELENKVLELTDDMKSKSILLNKLTEIKERNKELENKILELTNDVENKNILLIKLSEIKEKNEELENKVLELTNDVESKNVLVNELSEFREQNENLVKEIFQLTDALKNQKILVNDLFGVKKKNEELEKKVSELTEELTKNKRETEDAKSSLDEKIKKVEYLDVELESNKKKMENYAEIISHLENKNEELLKEVDEKENFIKNFKENETNLIKNLKEEIKLLKEDNEKLRKVEGVLLELSPPNKNCKTGKLEEVVTLEKKEKMHELDDEKEIHSENYNKSTLEIEDGEDRENVLNKETITPEKLAKQLGNLTFQQTKTKSTRKKVDCLDESIHPSTIKKSGRGRKKKKEEENISKTEEDEGGASKKKGKCYKQLFLKNDFDSLSDLNSSTTELEIPRLRPRK